MSTFQKIQLGGLVGLNQLVTRLGNWKRGHSTPKHIIFCMVDHYEPGTGGVTLDEEIKRVDDLLEIYPKISNSHRDSSGRGLPRTWFFPPHYHRNGSLNKLVKLCSEGYGEIELHLHHGKICPDTDLNLKKTLSLCLDEYEKFGIFGNMKGKKAFGFIHGDWALANTRNGRYCGVENELAILKDFGCYADFTFPSLNEANPYLINSIFYSASKSNGRFTPKYGPKSLISQQPPQGLMIIQGPLHLQKIKSGLFGYRVLGDAIDNYTPINKERVDCWVKSNIHVSGKDDWVFIKVHTHGATDAKSVLGKGINDICMWLNRDYNDGKNHVLHYVTAREFFNIIKAAEAGENGTAPTLYRDYLISPPDYKPNNKIVEASPELLECVHKTYS